MSETEPELDKLRKKVKQLEQDLEKAQRKSSFWAVSNWEDAVKLMSLPLAFILGIYTLYDDVWLRWRGQDAATIAQVIDGLTRLQELDQTTFVHQAKGDTMGASAVDAAQRGQRERLVAQAFSYWQRRPEFFQRGELDTLTHHLIIQKRTLDALAVINTLIPQAQDEFDKADLLLKTGRAYAAPGDAFNLDAARTALDEAATEAEKIMARGTRMSAITNITFYKVFMELQNEQGCEHITPHILTLNNLSALGTPAKSALDQQIAQLHEVYQDRCKVM